MDSAAELLVPDDIVELIGVYDADGGLRGEVAYVVGKALGRTHCSLCDVTHSPVRRKKEWDRFVTALSVPFVAVHRNERDPDVAAATGSQTPCVVARTQGQGVVMVLEPTDLVGLGGSVEAFGVALAEALASRFPETPS